MKKNLLKSMLAVALLSLGCMNASAEDATGTAPVKMTYVSGSDADVDVAYGVCDTIKAGWNLGNNVAVGSTITFGNKNWGANWIGVLQADASAIPGTIQKATLKAKVSGSLDNKRVTGWGVALTDNAWSADLTYTTVGPWTVSALLNGGVQVWTTSKSSTQFEEHEWDITDAFAGGQSIATILVYEGVKDGNGGAAGGFMTEAVVEVEYEPFEATSKTYDFEDAVIPFKNGTNSGDGRITAAIEDDATLNSKVLGWTCTSNSQNGYSFSYYDFTDLLSNPALVKVEFDYYNTKGARAVMTISDAMVRGTDGHCEKTTYKSTGAIFRIGSDKTGNANEAFINDIMLKQDDVTTSTPIIDEETGEETGTIETTEPGLCNKWMHVVVLVNNDARTVTWVVTDMNGELIHSGSDKFYSDDANACSQIDLFGYIKNSHCAMIDNLTITNYKSNAVFADYTIKYVDAQDNELKESRTGNGQVGKPVKLLDSDKAAIVADGQKYVYESDNTAEVVIAEEGTVIKVVFREAEKYYAVLNCKAGDETLYQFRDLEKYWFFEGDNYAIYPSRAYKGKDGSYYFTPATSWNGVVFSFPGAAIKQVGGGKTYYIGTQDYALVDTVAYYSEIERLALPVEDAGYGTGLGQLVGDVAPFVAAKGEQEPWYNWTGGLWERFSGGRGIRLGEGSFVYTEPIAEAATYKVTIYGRNDNSNLAQKPVLGLRDAQGEVELFTELTIPEQGTAATGAMVIEGVAIPAGSSLVIMNAGDATYFSMDDISMAISGEYVAPVTVGIQNVEKAQQNGVIYNLAGQAVKAVQKGLYIKNGKKYIVK